MMLEVLVVQISKCLLVAAQMGFRDIGGRCQCPTDPEAQLQSGL